MKKNKETSVHKEIIYFPYLFMGDDEVDLGFAKVINADSDLSKYCSDQTAIDYVRDLLKAFYEGKNTPIKGIGLLKFDELDLFEPVPELDKERLDEVRNILFISTLSLSNTSDRNNFAGWSAIASDNFDYFIQPFIVGKERFGSENGFIVTKNVYGYKVGELHFKIPEYVLEPKSRIDDYLLSELLWLKANSPVIYKRFLRSSDFVYQSSSNNPRFSINSRILLMAASFEVLLQLPTTRQREFFRDKIEDLTKNRVDKIVSFWSKRRPGRSSVRRSGSYQKWWADNFYTLRNKIVHGDNLISNDYIFHKSQRHFDISVLMYLLSLKRIINKRKKKKVFFDLIYWGKHSDGENNYVGFRYDHQIIAKLVSEEYDKISKK